MLEEAVKKSAEDDTDYYVSGLWDLFRTICDHSIYKKEVWENPDANHEFPTPFAFSLKEIQQEFYFLCDHCFSNGNRLPGRLGRDLASTWSVCVVYLGESKGKVPPGWQRGALYRYFDYTLQLRQVYIHEDSNEERKENCKVWSDLFITELKEKVRGFRQWPDLMFEVANSLDMGKQYIFDNHQWLREELGLPDRPPPQE